MSAIRAIRGRLEKNPDTPSSKVLGRFVAALAEERAFRLRKLFEVDYDSFEMALDLMKDWRIERSLELRGHLSTSRCQRRALLGRLTAINGNDRRSA